MLLIAGDQMVNVWTGSSNISAYDFDGLQMISFPIPLFLQSPGTLGFSLDLVSPSV
jgi:hypothetical protein